MERSIGRNLLMNRNSLVLTCLLLSLATGWADTHYCSPSGGGSGADFDNLMTLPDTTGFTRGDTYVLVDGSYGAKTLSKGDSGTTLITIRKASTDDSGW